MPFFEGSRGRVHYRVWPTGGVEADRPRPASGLPDRPRPASGLPDRPRPASGLPDRPRPASGATLVFLHGRGQHTGQYHRFGAAMARRGISTWALDHIGHGLSEGDPPDGRGPGDLDDLAENAATLVELAAQAHGGRPAVMGHSLGSATAVRMISGGTAVSAVVLVAVPAVVVPRDHLVEVAAAPTLALHGVDDRMVPIDQVRALTRGLPMTVREYENAGHDLLHEKVHQVVTDAAADHVLGSREAAPRLIS